MERGWRKASLLVSHIHEDVEIAKGLKNHHSLPCSSDSWGKAECYGYSPGIRPPSVKKFSGQHPIQLDSQDRLQMKGALIDAPANSLPSCLQRRKRD